MAVLSSSIATMTKAIMACAILLFIHTTPFAGEVAGRLYVTAHFRNGRTVVSPRGPVRMIARRVGFVNFYGGFSLDNGDG